MLVDRSAQPFNKQLFKLYVSKAVCGEGHKDACDLIPGRRGSCISDHRERTDERYARETRGGSGVPGTAGYISVCCLSTPWAAVQRLAPLSKSQSTGSLSPFCSPSKAQGAGFCPWVDHLCSGDSGVSVRASRGVSRQHRFREPSTL